MSKDPPLSLTSFVEYYHEMLKYFKTRVLGKVMIHCYYSRLHFGFSFSFPTLAFFIKQNSISKEVQIGGAVESIRKVMFSFREQPKFFCTVSAALQHSFSGRQKMAGFRRMQTKTSLLSPSRHLLIQNVFSAYYQNCNNLNLKLDNTTLSCNLKLKKALENVSIAKNLNIATKYHMLGLKIFVQV